MKRKIRYGTSIGLIRHCGSPYLFFLGFGVFGDGFLPGADEVGFSDGQAGQD